MEEETRKTIEEIWRMPDFRQDDPLNTLNKCFINGLIASEYFGIDGDSFLKKILAKLVMADLQRIEEWKEAIRGFYESHKTELPRIWELWHEGEISFGNGICGREMEDGQVPLEKIAQHLEELKIFHQNSSLQKKIFWLGRQHGKPAENGLSGSNESR